MKLFLTTILIAFSVQLFSQCDPSFTYLIEGHSVRFFPKDSTSSIRHAWHFGDGNSSSDLYGQNSYNQPGIYQITHIVKDSLTHCTDSTKQTIALNYTPKCQSSFYHYSSFPDFNSVTFQSSSSTTGTSIIQYIWKVNGVTVYAGEEAYVSYTFNNPGSYQICLEINTSSGCTSTYCETISVMSTCNIISDFSYKASPNNARYIEFEPKPNNPDLRYKWLKDENQQFYGSYEFQQAGKHEITMFVIDSIKNCYDSIKKTIDVKGNRFDSCTASFTNIADKIFPNQLTLSVVTNQPILTQYWSIKNSEGFLDSIITFSGDPVKYLFPDTGSYFITVRIETNSGCSIIHNDVVHVASTQINSPRETLISYPNPANNYLVLPFTAEDNGIIQISIYNSMGNKVQTEKKTIVTGNNQLQISIQSLSKGQYYIHLKFNNRILKSRFQKL